MDDASKYDTIVSLRIGIFLIMPLFFPVGIEKFFTHLLEADSDSSPAIAAIETLLELVNRSKGET